MKLWEQVKVLRKYSNNPLERSARFCGNQLDFDWDLFSRCRILLADGSLAVDHLRQLPPIDAVRRRLNPDETYAVQRRQIETIANQLPGFAYFWIWLLFRPPYEIPRRPLSCIMSLTLPWQRRIISFGVSRTRDVYVTEHSKTRRSFNKRKIVSAAHWLPFTWATDCAAILNPIRFLRRSVTRSHITGRRLFAQVRLWVAVIPSPDADKSAKIGSYVVSMATKSDLIPFPWKRADSSSSSKMIHLNI